MAYNCQIPAAKRGLHTRKGIEPDHYITNKKPLDMSGFEEFKRKEAASRRCWQGRFGNRAKAFANGLYLENVDEEYDAQTEAAVWRFQEIKGLHPYGVADLTTQIAIMEEAFKVETTIDRQMDKALRLYTK